ncbi:MAG TPA: hypothetical protein VK826_00820 [Bacteroidia bacterium]|nr:hypothetical protein [Bacteroidia bacterium]
MNIYVTQLKQSIQSKLDQIEDAEYLSSLDAILTYETHDMPPRDHRKPLQKSFWKRLWLTYSSDGVRSAR